MEIAIYITLVLVIICICLLFIFRPKKATDISSKIELFHASLQRLEDGLKDDFQRNREENAKLTKDNRDELNNSLKEFRAETSKSLQNIAEENSKTLEKLSKMLEEKLILFYRAVAKDTKSQREIIEKSIKNFQNRLIKVYRHSTNYKRKILST